MRSNAEKETLAARIGRAGTETGPRGDDMKFPRWVTPQAEATIGFRPGTIGVRARRW